VTLELDGGHSERLAEFAGSYAARRRKSRWSALLYGALFAVALIVSASVSQFSFQQLASGLPDAWGYIASTLPSLHVATIGRDLGAWYWNLPDWLELLAETALMSFMGTVMGAGAALLFCFSASRNLVRSASLYFASRRLLELARTVPDLVYAMIFVFAFGIGPLAGVLALAMHTTGALGKLFAEVNECVDHKPIDSLEAAGANWPMTMRFAVLPQVLPNFVSYTLLRFEYNIRTASVLGIVGAGGIGEQLYIAIRQFDYSDISAIALLIIAVVMVADLSCEAIRSAIISKEVIRRQ
jgi:phosphonate transport system permease protein